MDAGKLVPDEVIIGIISERLQEPDCANGYILDGVPRTIAQAEAIETMGIRIDKVLELSVADDVIVERMSGRRVCEKCGASYHIVAVPPKAEGVCDVCGRKEVPVPTRKADYPAESENTVMTGTATCSATCRRVRSFAPVDGQSLSYRNYYYQRSTDGGMTWGPMQDFSEAIFGMTTIQITELTEGEYHYRFYASHDGVHFSKDTWTLKLHVEDVPTMDFTFYVGKDYTGAYPHHPALQRVYR